MNNAGDKLVVIDFTSAWCDPFNKIAPVFEELSVQYPNIVFLKVDVEEVEEIAIEENIESMPTFIFKRNETTIDTLIGANITKLKELIHKHSKDLA